MATGKMADSIHDQIQAERKAALPEAAQVRDFRDYARGRQRGTLTPGQQRILRGLLGNLFCDNVCKRVLQELRNRLRLARFEVAGNGQPAEAIGTYLETLWTLNQIPALSGAAHWAMLRDGNHAVGLAWQGDQGGRVILMRERWWNGKSGIFVAYDGQGRPTYAVKDWKEGTQQRRTIWFPERIERYAMAGKGWNFYALPSDPGGVNRQPGPVPWTINGERDGEPLGIPIVHFANIQVPNDGNEGTTEPDPFYGMSELDGGLLGLQDEVNDLHRDISAAARFAGYQMLYGTGITPSLDPATGRQVTRFFVEPGAFFEEPNPNAKFGVLPPGSLAELERALSIKLQAVGRHASVPMHLVSGDWPSGEALLRAEMPLIDKVETIGASVGPAWASVAHKATRLANAYGRAGLDESLLIASVFASVARRDPLTLALVAEKFAPFVSKAETLRTLGHGPKDIERILQEMEEEARRFNPQGEAELALLRKQIGASLQEALRTMGYSEARIAQVMEEREASSAELGQQLLTAFDGGEGGA